MTSFLIQEGTSWCLDLEVSGFCLWQVFKNAAACQQAELVADYRVNHTAYPTAETGYSY